MEKYAPGMPFAFEESTDLVVFPDGSKRADLAVTFTKEQIQRIRSGYKCLKCWEDYDNAWPDTCVVCGYAIKANQAADFARDYEGEKYVGPSTSIREELDRLDWLDEEAEWKRKGGTGIVVPAGVKEGTTIADSREPVAPSQGQRED